MALKLFSLAATARALQNLIKNSPKGVELAIEGIMKQMETDAKSNGRYTDITGNLRDSITGVVLKGRETKTEVHSGDTTKLINTGQDIVGVLFAGMEYGIFVELLDNKDVIGNTVKKWKRRIPKLLGKEIRTRGTYQRDFEKGNK